MKLLCLSNGHGEDVIAVRILSELQKQSPTTELVALPIVGTGNAYQHIDIPLWGKTQSMPSGGFLNMDSQQLWRDIQGGLLQLTLAQQQAVRSWAQTGGQILAVGDIVPLLMAWHSGAAYAFVGTAKSEYYGHDGVYFPWERWLLSRPNCKAVFPRDRITTEALRKFAIPAFNLGNPMMDGLALDFTPDDHQDLRLTLLPGSRPPEAYHNWEIILQGLDSLLNVSEHQAIGFIAAIAPTLNTTELATGLQRHQWQSTPQGWVKDQGTLQIWTDRYAAALAYGDLAIAMAGTATEQFVGLGKPAITLPGPGPQFTRLFAERQTRLLGASVLLVDSPQTIGATIQVLWADLDRRQRIKKNGLTRMGTAGAAAKIADSLLKLLPATTP